MKKISIYLIVIGSLSTSVFGDDNVNNANEALRQMFQAIWTEAMTAKQQINEITPQTREELLEN